MSFLSGLHQLLNRGANIVNNDVVKPVERVISPQKPAPVQTGSAVVLPPARPRINPNQFVSNYNNGYLPATPTGDWQPSPQPFFTGTPSPLQALLNLQAQRVPDYYDQGNQHFAQFPTGNIFDPNNNRTMNIPIDQYGNTPNQTGDVQLNPNLGPGSNGYGFQHLIPLVSPTFKANVPPPRYTI